MKILRVLALLTALMLVTGACGGGGDDDSDEDTGAAATETPAEDHSEHMAFCESVIEAETAVLAAASGGGAGPSEELLAEVEETAPAELEEQVGIVLGVVREALEKKDDRAFESPEFTSNEEELDQWVATNCGYPSIPVTAVDYAFEGVPETVAAGPTSFTFTNQGEELHEMLMVRFKDESLGIKDLMKLSDKEAQSKLDFLGASFGPPGTVDTEARVLAPGKYALLCFVPVGSTSEKAARKADGPPHVARGMSAEFTVE